MKIKKKELRKREAQLPINFPDPTVLPEALPGGVLDLQKELVQVEYLCKQLAHNEVAVRDSVLTEIPLYLEKVTAHLPELEKNISEQVTKQKEFYITHPNADKLYHYDNLFRALHEFHVKAMKNEQNNRRRNALHELRERQAEERNAKEQYGKYQIEKHLTNENPNNEEHKYQPELMINANHHKQHEEHFVRETHNKYQLTSKEKNVVLFQTKSITQREVYLKWVEAWSDIELIFLKLSRGLHFCLWHSDKPLVQLECANKIASLIHAPQTIHAKLLFYGALFRVLAREWPTIDRYRLDKYLALVRKMMFTLCKLMKMAESNENDVATSDATFFDRSEKIDEERQCVTIATVNSETNIVRNSPKRHNNINKNHITDDVECNRGNDTATIGKEVVGASNSSPVDKTEKINTHLDLKEKRKLTNEKIKKSSINTANSIVNICIDSTYNHKPILQQSLHELTFLFHIHIFSSLTSTGLTMHICDVIFDELNRAFLTSSLFITLSVIIPLYAMSQGNFVEKRVLDNFFPPLVGGSLVKRRAKQWTVQLTKLRYSQEMQYKMQKQRKKTEEPQEKRIMEQSVIKLNCKNVSSKQPFANTSFSSTANDNENSISGSDGSSNKSNNNNEFTTSTNSISPVTQKLEINNYTTTNKSSNVNTEEVNSINQHDAHTFKATVVNKHNNNNIHVDGTINTSNELAEMAELRAHEDYTAIVSAIMEACKLFAVARGTVHGVRVMFSEAQLVLSQSLNPTTFTPLSTHAQKQQISREIEEVNEIQRRVREERAAVRELKRQRRGFDESVTNEEKTLYDTSITNDKNNTEGKMKRKRSAVLKNALATSKNKTNKRIRRDEESMNINDEYSPNNNDEILKKGLLKKQQKLTKNILANKLVQKVKQNTKRKKYYTLTKQDLYGSSDDDDDDNDNIKDNMNNKGNYKMKKSFSLSIK